MEMLHLAQLLGKQAFVLGKKLKFLKVITVSLSKSSPIGHVVELKIDFTPFFLLLKSYLY
jgi:hypothetical protein